MDYNHTNETVEYERVSISGATLVDGDFMLTSPEFCVQFDQLLFWQSGDYWNSLEDLPHVMFAIDDEEVPYFRRSTDAIRIEEVDSNGDVIGTHGYWFEYCVLIDDQTTGQRDVRADVIVDSERIYQYFWIVAVE